MTSVPLYSRGKKKNYIKTVLFCSLIAIIVFNLFSSLPGLYHSVGVYQESKRINFLNDVSDDLFTAVANYGFERGRVNVVLNDTGPVKGMEANRQFINARRTEGDQALKSALEKISRGSSGGIQSQVSALNNLINQIKQLRVQTAKDLVVIKKNREKNLAEVWFEAMTEYIKSIEGLLVTISQEITDGDGTISLYSSLKYETLALRNTAGPEMSILSGTILSEKPVKPNLAEKIETLYTLTNHHFEKISFLCQGISSPSLSDALDTLLPPAMTAPTHGDKTGHPLGR